MTETIALHDVECVRDNGDDVSILVMKDGREIPFEDGAGVERAMIRCHNTGKTQTAGGLTFECGDGISRLIEAGRKPRMGTGSRLITWVPYQRVCWSDTP